jgi:hypothetical protein
MITNILKKQRIRCEQNKENVCLKMVVWPKHVAQLNKIVETYDINVA